MRWAIDHAQPGDTVKLLHAWESAPVTIETGLIEPDNPSGARIFVHHELARLEAFSRDQGVTVVGEMQHGDARNYLRAAKVDLLVIGASRHGSLVGALLGSVSAHLARHTRVPLVIVPHPLPPDEPAVPV